MALYDDLLALSPDKSQDASHLPANPPIEEHDNAVIQTILSRFSPLPSTSPDAFSALMQRAEPTSLQGSHETQSHPHESRPSLPHRVVLSLLTPIIQESQSTSNVFPSSDLDSPLVNGVPLAILSVNEWRSLTRVCVRTCARSSWRHHNNVECQLAHDDLHSVKINLQLMMVCHQARAAETNYSFLKRHREYN